MEVETFRKIVSTGVPFLITIATLIPMKKLQHTPVALPKLLSERDQPLRAGVNFFRHG